MPSLLKNQEGKERTVGFEFEFSGMDTQRTASLIQNLFGGQIISKNRFEAEVANTSLGKFSVALDARLIKEQKYLAFLDALGIQAHDAKNLDWWENLVEDVATLAVPYEISCPPVPVSKLEGLEKLREAMHANSATGTKARPQYAFGMHLNPEVPDLSVQTVLKGLQSFLIHYPWLLEKLDIDLARRMAPFIHPFPDDYQKLVLSPAYEPDKNSFAEDYLKFNPTRNRPLDLLPILSIWDEEKVRSTLPGQKVTARPTFHYRMPNCLFDDPLWNLARDWNLWVEVEELAWTGNKLSRLASELRDEMECSPLRWPSAWLEKFGENRR